MAQQRVQRRLAAILVADVVGYSRLMRENEAGTLAQLMALHKDLLEPKISEYGGRIVKTTGDGILVEFPSAVDAVQLAIDVQQEIKRRSTDLPKERRMEIRVGINVGDVIVVDDDLFGDGVNVAARLEVLADPGGVCLSSAVFDQVRGKVDHGFEDLGEQGVKNIEEPVHVYRVASKKPPAAGADRGLTSSDSAPLEFGISARPWIAILPFKDLSADSGYAYLADGIRLGIQAALVHVSGVSLLNPSSVEAYRAKDVSPATAGNDLNVRFILDGAVQTAGNRMRATLQLTDVRDNRMAWAERYDSDLDDIFDVQDEIVRQVMASLNVELLPAEASRVTLSKLTHKEAIEKFYEGISCMYKGTKNDNATARQMFEEVSRLEPNSGTAPSIIALTHWLDAISGWTDNVEQSMAQAVRWAEKSTEFQDHNGFGSVTLGQIKLLEGKHNEALTHAQEAGSIRCNCPLSHGQLANVLNYCGDAPAAVKSARYALNLTRIYPVWMINVLAAAYRDSGELNLSIAAAKEAARLDPKQTAARAILCSDYVLADRLDEARSMAREIVAIDPGFRLSSYARSQPYKDPEVLDDLIQVLRGAGLPD